MNVVLDAGAFFSRFMPEGKAGTTPAVAAEVRDAESRRHLDALRAAGILSFAEPSDASLSQVRNSCARAGDTLSFADVSILALAIDTGARLITDDYGVQNVALRLGIPWSPSRTEGITGPVRWKCRCSGCGRRYPPSSHDEACEVCGSRIVRRKA